MLRKRDKPVLKPSIDENKNVDIVKNKTRIWNVIL
jgi:hypothetical protein